MKIVMNYEEKYKEALGKAIEIYNRKDATDCGKTILESVFPGLKESSDEKIKKSLIELVKQSSEVLDRQNQNNMIAWLENQGHEGKKWIYEDVYIKEKEQVFQDGIDEVLENPQKYGLEKQGEKKPTDKVEPKFKVGDWIIRNNEHNSIWSEEDERICRCLIKDQNDKLDDVYKDRYGHSEIVSDLKKIYRERIKWLKSLKEKFQ